VNEVEELHADLRESAVAGVLLALLATEPRSRRLGRSWSSPTRETKTKPDRRGASGRDVADDDVLFALIGLDALNADDLHFGPVGEMQPSA
jgi:hypothetical protein